jgi:hypothetical protein
MRFGSEGRFFNIDFRISRDCRAGGEDGGEVGPIGLVLNCKFVSRGSSHVAEDILLSSD